MNINSTNLSPVGKYGVDNLEDASFKNKVHRNTERTKNSLGNLARDTVTLGTGTVATVGTANLVKKNQALQNLISQFPSKVHGFPKKFAESKFVQFLNGLKTKFSSTKVYKYGAKFSSKIGLTKVGKFASKIAKKALTSVKTFLPKALTWAKALPGPAKFILGAGALITTLLVARNNKQKEYIDGRIDQKYIDKTRLENF